MYRFADSHFFFSVPSPETIEKYIMLAINREISLKLIFIKNSINSKIDCKNNLIISSALFVYTTDLLYNPVLYYY